MKAHHILIGASFSALLLAGCGNTNLATMVTSPAAQSFDPSAANSASNMNDKVIKTDKEWKQELTPEQYRVLRQKDTERPFTGAYWNSHEPGVYRCAACGLELFLSGTKFDSGCGWPSFSAPAGTNAVASQPDHSLGMDRTEVLCPRCGGHLGHVFDDGPKPTGLRYCINSAALKFEPNPPPLVLKNGGSER
jgi:peptide-methionine (R)-S-oxide reductase